MKEKLSDMKDLENENGNLKEEIKTLKKKNYINTNQNTKLT